MSFLRQPSTIATNTPDPDVCRDDRCPREDLHPPHKIRGVRAERPKQRRRRSLQVWEIASPAILHEIVYASVSATLARPFSAVYRLVTADYGTCDERTVHRHLRLLRDEGKVVRVEVEPGKHFAIYLRAESKLLHNIDEIREDLHDLIESHRISAGRKKER
jgi:hypothetical protein